MADPQVENGHTKIANEILDALCRTRLKSSDRQVLDAVIRKTYGYNKKADKLSIGQIMSITGLSRRTVIYSLESLEAKNMIVVQRIKNLNPKLKMENEINTIKFQKDHEKWVVQRNGDGYSKLLERQRDKYKNGGSAKKEGGAKNAKKVVQRNAGGSANSLHPQKTIQKTNTKDSSLGQKKNLKTDHSRFVEWYYDNYLSRFGVKYKFTGKDAKIVQALLTDYPLEELKKITEIYWNMGEDEFVVNSGFSIGVLSIRANAIAIRERGTNGKAEKRSWRERKALEEHRQGPTSV